MSGALGAQVVNARESTRASPSWSSHGVSQNWGPSNSQRLRSNPVPKHSDRFGRTNRAALAGAAPRQPGTLSLSPAQVAALRRLTESCCSAPCPLPTRLLLKKALGARLASFEKAAARLVGPHPPWMMLL